MRSYKLYQGDAGHGPYADVLVVAWFAEDPTGNGEGSLIGYLRCEGGGYRFVKEFQTERVFGVAPRTDVQSTRVRSRSSPRPTFRAKCGTLMPAARRRCWTSGEGRQSRGPSAGSTTLRIEVPFAAVAGAVSRQRRYYRYGRELLRTSHPQFALRGPLAPPRAGRDRPAARPGAYRRPSPFGADHACPAGEEDGQEGPSRRSWDCPTRRGSPRPSRNTTRPQSSTRFAATSRPGAPSPTPRTGVSRPPPPGCCGTGATPPASPRCARSFARSRRWRLASG